MAFQARRMKNRLGTGRGIMVGSELYWVPRVSCEQLVAM